jgi:uncharacterized protein
MAFIFKKSTLFSIYLLLVCCSGVYVTKGMEQAIVKIEKKAGEEANLWKKVPEEIKAYIISFLVSAKDAKEAIRNIRSLSQVSKAFRDIIGNPSVVSRLLQDLYSRYSKSSVEIALALNNPGATEWFKSYIQYNPQNQGSLDQLLAEAAKVGNREAIQFLLGNEADTNAADTNGYTPLYWAVFFGNKNGIKLLLKYGADVNKANNKSRTPLQWAVYDVVDFLLKFGAVGADINAQQNFGYTPLHYAAFTGSKDTVELLLNAGADATIANTNGKTPLSVAISKNHEDIVKLLQKSGASK